MVNNMEIEKSLKRFIKTKKLGYSVAMLVSFLITGNILSAAELSSNELLLKEVQMKKAEILLKLAENNERLEEIDKEILALIKEGDSYAKTLENNKQFFFPLTWEHRHASKGDHNGFFDSGEVTPEKDPDITITENIEPIIPTIPEVPELPPIDINVPEFDIGSVGEPDVKIEHGDIIINDPNLDFEVAEVGGITVDVNDDITIGNITIVTDIPNVDLTSITDANPGVVKYAIDSNYEPRFITEPKGFDIDDVNAPNDTPLPVIDVKAGAFGQGGGGIMKNDNTENGAVIENYTSYTTKKDNEYKEFEVKFNGTGVSYGDNNITIGYKDYIDDGIYKEGTIEAKSQLRTSFPEDRKSNTVAFISDTRAGDTLLEGKYKISFDGETSNQITNKKRQHVRIFLSLNPAGTMYAKQYNTIGTSNGGHLGNVGIENDPVGGELKKYYDDDKKLRQVKKLTFGIKTDKDEDKTKVELSNTSNSGILVGIDHQTWDTGQEKTKPTGDLQKVYSILENNAEINLGKVTEKNVSGEEETKIAKKMIGIMIDVEHGRKAEDKYYNHKTINNGIININATESIGISFEEAVDPWNQYFHLRDDLYVGNIVFDKNSKSNYGLRLGNIINEQTKLADDNGTLLTTHLGADATNQIKTYYDDVRIFGNGKIDKGNKTITTGIISTGTGDKVINVNGEQNVGVTIAKSLSDSAVGYIKGNNLGSRDYTEDTVTGGYESGNVDPIANIHGLNIKVGGSGNVGFLRDRDYSNNNKNDMVIQENDYEEIDGKKVTTGKEAITEIAFKEDAQNSVLIRTDRYGITVEKDLIIGETGAGIQRDTNGNPLKDEDGKIISIKNVVLQATADSWNSENDDTKENTNHSVGTITNEALISGSSNGLVGMMASGSLDEGQSDNGKTAAVITNNGKIEFTGTSTIGMAVLGNNEGYLTGKDGNNKAEISVNAGTASNDETEYNLGIYNQGTFTVENGKISANGAGSMGIYNEGTVKIGLESKTADKTENIISVSDGAVGIYSKGGTVTGKNITITSDGASSKNVGGIGVYATDGANVVLENADIDVTGTVGIAAVKGENGENSTITIKGGNITYDGDGYALFTSDDVAGKTINFGTNGIDAKSTLTLEGKSFGMKLDLTKDSKDQPIDLSNLNINVTSDDATVFNLVHETGGSYNIGALMSKIGEEVKQASGFNINSINKVNGDPDGATVAGASDLYKIAIVDGGELTIDKGIAQSDPAGVKDDGSDGFGYFYFKRFLGQRLDIAVGQNVVRDNDGNITSITGGVTVDGTMSAEHADKYFAGQIVGLEMNSSAYAKNNTEAKITVGKDSKIIANRLNGTADDKGAIGLYGNFGTITLNSGSTVEVEKQDDTAIEEWKKINTREDESEGTLAGVTEDKIYDEGVGIFAVNGSVVDIKGETAQDAKDQAKVDVYGDKAVGVYGLAYRVDSNGNIKVDEFNNENDIDNKGQGKIVIKNAGDISLTGNGAVGIYAEDNNIKDTNRNAEITNLGNITVDGVHVDDKGTYTSGAGIHGIGATITNTGKITVGTTNQKVSDNDGEVRIGSVGIYAENSVITGKSLGEITLGKYSTGIMLDKDSDITATGTLTLKSLGGDAENTERMGVVYSGVEDGPDGPASENWSTAKYSIDMSGVVGGKALVVSEGALTFGDAEDNINETIKVNGKKSRGVRALTNGNVIISKGTTIELVKEATTDLINAGEGSIGMLAMDTNGTLNNEGTININSQNGIGIYATNKGADRSGNTVTGIGTINLNSQGAVGVFVEGDETETDKEIAINLGTGGNGENAHINFNDGSQNAIGIYAENSKIILADLDNKDDTDDKKAHGTANILVYANGTDVVNNGTITVADNIKAGDTTTAKTIGLYLKNGSTYTGTGKINAESGAIGLYTDLAEGKNMSFKQLNLGADSKGINTIGAVFIGEKAATDNAIEEITVTKGSIVLNNSKADTYDAQSANKAVGIYAEGIALNVGTMNIEHGEKQENAGQVTYTNGSNGTGIYLKDGAYLSDGTITLSGKGIAVDLNNDKEIKADEIPMSVGVYYAGQEPHAAGDTNKAGIVIEKDNTIGILVNKDLTNEGVITIKNAGEGQKVGFYGVGKTLTQKGDITLAGKNSVGVLVKDSATTIDKGNIIFTGNININGAGKAEIKDGKTVVDYRNVGLYGETGDITVDTGSTIKVAGDYGVGIVSEGTVDSNGTITVTGKAGTGVYLENGATFNGKDSTIIVEENSTDDTTTRIGVYLKNGAELGDGAGQLYVANGNVGIYAEGSNVSGTAADNKTAIDISKTSEGKTADGGIAIAAISKGSTAQDGTTTVSNLEITLGTNSAGIYALDSGVKIDNVNVKAVQDGKDGDSSTVGIYLKDSNSGKDYSITNSGVEIKKGIGIYVNNVSGAATGLALGGSTITVNSYSDETVDGKETESGIGIYVQNGGKLASAGNTYNISNGIGVFGDDKSEVTLAGDTINLKGYSIGTFTDGGKITITGGTADFAEGKVDSEDTGDIVPISGSLAYAHNGDIYNGTISTDTTTGATSTKDNGMDITVGTDKPVKDFVGLLGVFDNTVHDDATASDKSNNIVNTGEINITGTSSVGIAATGDSTKDNMITNTGNITISGVASEIGKMSAGIYSTSAGITNTGAVNVGVNAAGIYYNSKETAHTINSTGDVKLTASAGVGAYLAGKVDSIKLGNINATEAGNLGIYITGTTKDGNSAVSTELGNITMGANSIGLYISAEKDEAGNVIEGTESKIDLTSNGTIEVGNAVNQKVIENDEEVTKAGNAIGVMVDNSTVKLGETKVTAGIGGTALYNVNGNVSLNDLSQLQVAAQSEKDNLSVGALVYTKGGEIHLTAQKNTTLTADGHFGLVITDGGKIVADNTDPNNQSVVGINVSNGGVGLVVGGAGSKYEGFTLGEVAVSGGEAQTKHSVGVYYFNRENFGDQNNAKN